MDHNHVTSLIVAFITVNALSNKGKESEPAETGVSEEQGEGEIKRASYMVRLHLYVTLRRDVIILRVKGTLHQYRLTERARMKERKRERDRDR